MAGPFGWIPASRMNVAQLRLHHQIIGGMRPFDLRAQHNYRTAPSGRYALWEFCKKLNGGKHIPYSWQLTGSCVGSNGANGLRTYARVEIYHGDPEMYPAADIWWPYTYGQSRRRGGMSGEGEGSYGSVWAEAIMKDGIFAQDDVPGLPSWKLVGDHWLQLTSRIEMEWSNGSAKYKEPYISAGVKHLIGTASRVKTTQDMRAAIVNGNPCTIASMFGYQGTTPKGQPVVNIAVWNGSWAHQMWVDEAWDHPTLGLIFRVGNDWGDDASAAPTQGEPPGGAYVEEKTMAKVLASWDCECYSLNKFAGWPVRTLDWGTI